MIQGFYLVLVVRLYSTATATFSIIANFDIMYSAWPGPALEFEGSNVVNDNSNQCKDFGVDCLPGDVDRGIY